VDLSGSFHFVSFLALNLLSQWKGTSQWTIQKYIYLGSAAYCIFIFKFYGMCCPIPSPSCKREYLALFSSLLHQSSFIGWWTNWHMLSAFLQVLLYAILLMILFSPFDMFYISSRFYFLRTVWRIILPLQVSFTIYQ